jgi:hypothetical protein
MLKRRLELLLASRRNIAGCLAALVGVGLMALGITAGAFGFALIAILYGVAFALTPAERGLALTYFQNAGTNDVEQSLKRLLTMIWGRVSDDIFQKVGSIAHSIVITLRQDGTSGDPTDPNVNLVRQTALSYLPEALNSYLAIPRIFAERRPVQDGKTAHDLLMDQLNLMDTRLDEVADSIAKNDTERLMANVRFLQERFAPSQLATASVSADASESERAKVV